MREIEQLYEELRPYSFAIAYRMLGSVAEAEDIVQEAFLRLSRDRNTAIESPKAYLATVTTRLALDALRSARSRREQYVGEWLPEPVLTEPVDDPAVRAELADSLSLAFLVVLETLSPEQRAVLLLHDVFDYRYDEVARIVGKTEANVRQLAVRARRHVAEGRPRFEVSSEQRDRLAERFFAAAQDGDVGALEALLADDVVLHGDGGGKAPQLARPVRGHNRVARTVSAWLRQAQRLADATLRRVELNGQPAALVLDRDGKLINVLVLEIERQRITSVSSIINPDKLRHLGPLADLGALVRAAREASGRSRSAPV
jgi:RNA polymerase sigma-70 factor (TIGR02957 family)